MRSVGILLATAFAMAAPAQASTVLFSDNFDGENGGVYSLNYTGFANWNVTSGSNVDVVFSGDIFGLDCNTGGCVDLAGTPGPGEIVSKNLGYAFSGGDLVRLSFDLSGSQRGASADDFYAGFIVDPSLVIGYGYNAGAGDVYFSGSISPLTFAQLIPGDDAWNLQSVFFIAGGNGGTGVVFGANGNANSQIGPLLDNVVLSTGAVPEPATWAMMIAGFGIAGASLRRRKSAVAFA
jgi:hypothetical protein